MFGNAEIKIKVFLKKCLHFSGFCDKIDVTDWE